MNAVYKNSVKLSGADIVAELLGEEQAENYRLGLPIYNMKPDKFVESRISGIHCDCNGSGKFDLLPKDDPAVVEGGKPYMVCRKCNCYSHL